MVKLYHSLYKGICNEWIFFYNVSVMHVSNACTHHNIYKNVEGSVRPAAVDNYLHNNPCPESGLSQRLHT